MMLAMIRGSEISRCLTCFLNCSWVSSLLYIRFLMSARNFLRIVPEASESLSRDNKVTLGVPLEHDEV